MLVRSWLIGSSSSTGNYAIRGDKAVRKYYVAISLLFCTTFFAESGQVRGEFIVVKSSVVTSS